MTGPPYIPNGGTLAYRVGELERDVTELRAEVRSNHLANTRQNNKILWSMLGLTFAIIASGTTFLITAQAIGPAG